MKLTADYHIHSNNSRFKISKSSIAEIARRANSLGLREVAITDHGYKHIFAADKQKLLAARDDIFDLNASLGTNVLLGVEADILSENGDLDVDDETLAAIDILIIGYHKMIKTDFASYFGKQKLSHEEIERATDAYVNAIKRYDVDIVAHPGKGLKVDLYRLGKTCAEYNVLIEINNRHCDYSEPEIRDLIRSGCQFVVSSDAYGAEQVGKVDNAMLLIEKYDIPSDRIVNVEYGDRYKSELDLEIEEDLKRYERLIKKQNASAGFDELSDETEYKLRAIAKEKGLQLEEVNDDKIDYKELLSEEERAIVERAEEFLRKNKY